MTDKEIETFIFNESKNRSKILLDYCDERIKIHNEIEVNIAVIKSGLQETERLLLRKIELLSRRQKSVANQ